MAVNATKFFTKGITAELDISEGDNVQELTLSVESGTCSITGTRAFNGMDSEAIVLAAGESLTLSSHGQNDPLEVTITPTGGTTNVIIKF